MKSIDQLAPARLSARIRSAANTKLPFSTETTRVSAGSLAASSPAMASTRSAICWAEKRMETVGRSTMAGLFSRGWSVDPNGTASFIRYRSFNTGYDVGRAVGRIVERTGERQPLPRRDRPLHQGIGTLSQHVVALAEYQLQRRRGARCRAGIHELAAHHV